MTPNEQVGKEYRFWMVWVEGKEGPAKKHFTMDDARLEAERLLRLPENKWRIAYLLEARDFGAIESPPVIWRTMTERVE
jgi:hypothetical protein